MTKLANLRPAARLLVSSALAAAACLSCGTPAAPGEDVGRSSSALFGGTNSPTSQDSTVHVLIQPPGDICSGLLVAPNLVLVASHCFLGGNFETNNDLSTCQLGSSVQVAPSAVTITVGASVTSPTQTAGVQSILVDTRHVDCEHDVAALVLSSPLTGVSTPPLLLDSLPTDGITVTEVGYGIIDEKGDFAGTRQQASGPLLSNNGGSLDTPGGQSVSIPTGYLVSPTGSCGGDSGGPLLDPDSNGLGSLVGNVGTTQITYPNGTSSTDCADALSVFAPYSTAVDFIERAFQAIGEMPWRAGRANPPADIGGACTLNNECNSNFCVQIGSQGTCSKTCSAPSDCTAPYACTDTGSGESVCLQPQAAPAGRGCSIEPGSGRADPIFWMAALAISGFLLQRGRARARRRGRAPWASVAVLGAFLTFTVSAGAQPPPQGAGSAPATAPSDKQQEARARFQRALELADDGDFDAALLELERAYDLAPSYRILYNIGLVCQQLKEYARAYDAFERYLKEGASEVPAERVDEVHRRIERLKGRVGYVVIQSTDPGAEIAVDDVSMGVTPIQGPLRVNSGERKITAKLPGRAPETRVIELAGGEQKTANFDFRAVLAPQSQPRSVVPWISWGVTVAVTGAAVTTGILTLNAKSDYDATVGRFGVTRDEVNSAWDKTHTLALTTDILAGVAVVAAGVSTYLTLRPPKSGASKETSHVWILPGGISGIF